MRPLIGDKMRRLVACLHQTERSPTRSLVGEYLSSLLLALLSVVKEKIHPEHKFSNSKELYLSKCATEIFFLEVLRNQHFKT